MHIPRYGSLWDSSPNVNCFVLQQRWILLCTAQQGGQRIFRVSRLAFCWFVYKTIWLWLANRKFPKLLEVHLKTCLSGLWKFSCISQLIISHLEIPLLHVESFGKFYHIDFEKRLFLSSLYKFTVFQPFSIVFNQNRLVKCVFQSFLSWNYFLNLILKPPLFILFS